MIFPTFPYDDSSPELLLFAFLRGFFFFFSSDGSLTFDLFCVAMHSVFSASGVPPPFIYLYENMRSCRIRVIPFSLTYPKANIESPLETMARPEYACDLRPWCRPISKFVVCPKPRVARILSG